MEKNEQVNNFHNSLIASKRSSIIRSQTTEFKKSSALENVRGLSGVKYNKDKIKTNYYKPWEMITLKCSKGINPLKIL